MKIASYNIMSGGFADYSHESVAPERLPAVRAAVAKIGADVMGLVDTFRWDKLYSLDQLRNLFGYKHVTCINLNDDRLGVNSNGLTLLSRQPWRNAKLYVLLQETRWLRCLK